MPPPISSNLESLPKNQGLGFIPSTAKKVKVAPKPQQAHECDFCGEICIGKKQWKLHLLQHRKEKRKQKPSNDAENEEADVEIEDDVSAKKPKIKMKPFSVPRRK